MWKLTECIFLLYKIITFIYRAHLKKTLKNDSLYEGLLPLVSPLLLFLLLTVWVVLSPGNILAKQPRLFLWMVGVAFSNVIVSMLLLVLFRVSFLFLGKKKQKKTETVVNSRLTLLEAESSVLCCLTKPEQSSCLRWGHLEYCSTCSTQQNVSVRVLSFCPSGVL